MQSQGPRQRGAFGPKGPGSSAEGNAENEEQRLDAMLAALGRGGVAAEAWDELHASARKNDRISELAFAFESVSQGKRIRALPPAVAAEFLFQAARFFGHVFGDELGAIAYLDRALAIAPAHAAAFATLETLLEKSQQYKKLADLYVAAAQQRPRGDQAPLLRLAVEHLVRGSGQEDKLIELLQQVLRLEPGDEPSRALLESLFFKANRFRDIVRLGEQALAVDPPPDPETKARLLGRIVELYADKLQEPERALPFIEPLLVLVPRHEGALAVAQRLVVVKGLAGRAAAALATAYETAGAIQPMAHYLAIELESTRGPKRAVLLARLGRIKQEHLGDPAFAFDAFEQALVMDPDDDVRRRYVALAADLRRDADAAKTLTRVLASAKDPALRARTGADLGRVLQRSGDPKRAKGPLTLVLSQAGAPDDAVLEAAYVLWEILEAERDERTLGDVLERIAVLEADPERQRAVNERLAEIATHQNDVPRAIGAYERLLTTNAAPKAREALGPLYEATGDYVKYGSLLEQRGNESPSEPEARALLLRAAQVRASDPSSGAAAIATCGAIEARFGVALDVLGLLIPLLENQRLWSALADALTREAGLLDGAARSRSLSRLGLVRLTHLQDAPGAIDAMTYALAEDATNKSARATLEKLAAAGEHRLAAARALEPLYRQEGARPLLLRVLDLRGALGENADVRLSALREAADLLAGGSAAETARALEPIARGLSESVASEMPLGEWFDRLDAVAQRGVDSGRRAATLARALGERDVTSAELGALARRAAEAYAESGDGRSAIALYRRALAFDPHSAELLGAIDGLLRDQGSPPERIALYRAALERADQPRRRELLHRIGGIERNDLGDLAAAVGTYRAALADDAEDRDARDALEALYVQSGRLSDLCLLLEERLQNLGGEESRLVRLRLADVAASQGDAERARGHIGKVLEDPELTPEHVDAAARAAETLGDANLMRVAFDRRVDMATDPGERIAWLDKLAVLELKRRNDPASAAESWKRAARLAQTSGDDANARRLYALARKASPDDAEVAAELARLCERAELWEELPRLYVAMANLSEDDDERVNLALRTAQVLSERLSDVRSAARYAGRAFELAPSRADALAEFERLSLAANARETFEQTIARVLARPEVLSSLSDEARASILLARARTLASDTAHADEAAEAYREILGDDRCASRRAEALEAFEALLAGAAAAPARREDRRWLFDFRARTAPEAERAGRWLAWAREEETAFGDPERALALYMQVLGVDPQSDEALSAFARLALASGKTEEALSALTALKGRAQGPSRVAIEREIARVLVEQTDRHAEALEPIEAVLASAPDDAEALALASRLLVRPDTRGPACALLERACDATADLGIRRIILERLLDAASVPEDLRLGWHTRLSDLLENVGQKDAALAAALRAAREMPGTFALWDRAEALARESSRPDDVAALYEDALARPLPPEQAIALGERAVQFYEEWFEDSAHIVRVLERVLAIDPAADWAFDRLKLLLDAAERWEDLFALYDRALAHSTGHPAREKRERLLEDAAQTAKDFANMPERAIGYFELLREQRPNDAKLVSALERLYERQGKHRELVALLSHRLPGLEADDARRARTRIAKLWLDPLAHPGPALDVLEPVLDRDVQAGVRFSSETVALLERILKEAPVGEPPESLRAPASVRPPVPSRSRSGRPRTSEPPPPPLRSVRQRAAAWLRTHYALVANDAELARMMLIELEAMARPKDRVRRHVEVAALFERVGDLVNAFEQLSLAVVAAPDDDALRARVADLAARADLAHRLADVLASAASVAGSASLGAHLTLQAATLRAERLGDAPGAIALLTPVLADRNVADEDVLAAATMLEPLLLAAGRAEERLAVIERLAAVTHEPAARRDAFGRAARLATEIGHGEHAIGLWETALAMNDRDAEALDQLVVLLDESRSTERLVQILENRARVAPDPTARRTDLVRVATLLAEPLGRAGRAVDAWRAIEAEFGEAEDAALALAVLFRKTERWLELAELLERRASRAAGGAECGLLLTELGDVRREKLRDARGAIAAYEGALAEDPAQAEPRAGLLALAYDEGRRAEAVAVLMAALRKCDDWLAILELLPARLAAAPGSEEKLAVLRESAEIAEARAGDPRRAFDAVLRAFVLAPGDVRLQAEVTRLAEATGGFREATVAYREAIDGAASSDPELVRHLWRAIGSMREVRLGDPRGALDAYLRVIGFGPENDAALAAARVAAGLGQWDVASRVLVDLARATGQAPVQGLDVLEQAASDAGAWDEATRALAEAAASGDLGGSAARDVATRIARWHLDRRADDNAAEAAFERALPHDPANVALLSSLADLRRKRPDHRLVDTLVRLSEAQGGVLPLLREACEVAAGHVGDRGLAIDLANKALALARTRLWSEGEATPPEASGIPSSGSTPVVPSSGSTPVVPSSGSTPVVPSSGSTPPEGAQAEARAFAEWSVETLARLHEQNGDAQAVLDVLMLGEALPFDLPVRLGMRRRAARTALDRLNDTDRAIALYWPLFDHDPRDAEAVDRLATVYTSKGRTGDLLRVRKRQIEAAADPIERMALRLEASRLLVDLGEGPRAVEMLRSNLEDAPDDAATVEKLAATLRAQSRHEELKELFCAQAELAEKSGRVAAAADFWAKAGGVALDLLGDAKAAAAHHARVVALAPRTASFETLARLAQDADDPGQAAVWLSKWLDVEPEHRVSTTLRLAEALTAAGQPEVAAQRLEQSLAEAPAAEPLRTRLFDIYRANGDLPRLAHAMAQGAAYAPDKATRTERLLAAAELFAKDVREPERAVPLLEQASELLPDDQNVRLNLASALADAKRHDDARAILRALIDSFGGRRPRERAPVHYRMARLELSAGNRGRALMELETAAKVDPQNATILGALAELARDDGQFDRAEKSYRALLVMLRRQDDAREPGALARSEVFLELAAIAERRGERERAREIVESALEAAAGGDFERDRLERILRLRGDYETLARALELRLSHLGDGPEAAALLSELAELYDEKLGRAEDALGLRMRAVANDPRAPAVHAAALALARRLGRVAEYVTGSTALVDGAISAGDTSAACALLGNLASVAEADLGDDGRAAALREKAIALGDRSPALLGALEVVYERLNEPRERARVLALRIDVEAGEGRTAEATSAKYRLAALKLGAKDTLDEGAELLMQALDREPDLVAAERALHRAAAIDPSHPRILELYERVARQPGHERALMDVLTLRARLPDATGEIVREAIDVAMRAGDAPLAESLLGEYVQKPSTIAEVKSLTWALASIASLRQAAGDWPGALAQKKQAAEAADPELARRLRFEIAEIAGSKLGDWDSAAEALERIFAADPTDREAWEPLAGVYRRTQSPAKLADLLGRLLETVEDAGERARLRFERLRTMKDHLGLDDAGAEPLLREALDEDPNLVDAALMLAAILEASGRKDELASLLARQIDAAKDRADGTRVASLALKLGAMLEATDRVGARNVYYAGLDWEPKNRGLLDALLGLLGHDEEGAERADILERRLALEEGPGAEAMALALSVQRAESGDEAGALRALEAGYRAYPKSDVLRARLSDEYKSHKDYRPLAELYVIDAAARTDPGEKVLRLRDAAAIYRDELGDPRGAAAAIHAARALVPNDAALLRDELDALVAAGDETAALAELDRALAGLAPSDPRRAELLTTRASIRSTAGDKKGAIDDLEGAFALDGASHRAALVSALQSAVENAEAASDKEASHAFRLRLAGVFGATGDADAARRLLVNLVRQDASDVAALRMLANLEVWCERWDTAVPVWKRLAGLETGEDAVAAALGLAEACVRAGRPADAEAALASARSAAPDNAAIRDALRRVYEAVGNSQELAALAIEEAGATEDPIRRFDALVHAGALLLAGPNEDPAGAIQALQQALAERPADLPDASHFGGVALLIDAYLMSTRVSDAAALLETVMAPLRGRRSRELSPLYWRVARVAAEQGDLPNELRALSQALDCDSQNGDVCANVAERALALDERDLATRALRAVTLLRTPGRMSKALAYQHLGEIAQRQGDARRALTLLRRAVTEDPGLDGARVLLNAIERET
jgi:tetratricopeptide (TPR) repeat protein